MNEECSSLWQKLSSALKPHVSADTFKRWFSGVQLVGIEDDTLTFRVPNNIYQFWIESNHMAALQAAIVVALGSPRAVKFTIASGQAPKNDNPTEIEVTEAVVDEVPEGKRASVLGLNPRNT